MIVKTLVGLDYSCDYGSCTDGSWRWPEIKKK